MRRIFVVNCITKKKEFCKKIIPLFLKKDKHDTEDPILRPRNICLKKLFKNQKFQTKSKEVE